MYEKNQAIKALCQGNSHIWKWCLQTLCVFDKNIESVKKEASVSCPRSVSFAQTIDFIIPTDKIVCSCSRLALFVIQLANCRPCEYTSASICPVIFRLLGTFHSGFWGCCHLREYPPGGVQSDQADDGWHLLRIFFVICRYSFASATVVYLSRQKKRACSSLQASFQAWTNE